MIYVHYVEYLMVCIIYHMTYVNINFTSYVGNYEFFHKYSTLSTVQYVFLVPGTVVLYSMIIDLSDNWDPHSVC